METKVEGLDVDGDDPVSNKIQEIDLDATLIELGMGRYQYLSLFLYGMILLYSSFSPIGFIFTAADVNYRCYVPECENDTTRYQVPWFHDAIPADMHNVEVSKCYRYSVKPSVVSDFENTIHCSSDMFDKTRREKCDKWVFSKEETSIASEFNIGCNRKMLTFVGTLNSIGQLVGLPWTGFVGDRYGRKFVVIVGSLMTAVCAVLQSLSQNYSQFLVLEFLESIFGIGTYSSALVLGMELVSSKQRPVIGAMISNFYAVGAVLVGFVMLWVRDWRMFLRILYAPGFIFILYIWMAPESVRWLQTKGRHKEVLKILTKAASVNQKPVLMEKLRNKSSDTKLLNGCDTNTKEYSSNSSIKSKGKSALKKAFTSKTILGRVIVCSYCWVSVTLIYYGLSVISVELTVGDKYWNFIASNAVEIPAGFLAVPILQKFSRRLCLSFLYFATGLACAFYEAVPTDIPWLQLFVYLASKCTISITASIIYIYTAEIFPTELRLSLLGFCSTIGRIGCMLAPQTPLLKMYFGPNAPIVLFGIVSVSAAASMFLLPETKGKKLPDTMKDIKESVRSKKSVNLS